MTEKLIKEIQESLEFAKSRGELNQEASWVCEQGVLIEYAEAEYILELLKKIREMKTPMQELLEWIRTTLPMDLETPRMIEQKIESMLEKEKEVMCEFAEYTRKCGFLSDQRGLMTTEELYDQTFNTKEK